MSQTLQLRIVSWDKQNYELFDNESNQYQEKTVTIGSSGIVVRNNTTNESEFVADLSTSKAFASDPNYRVLLVIQVIDGQFHVGSTKQFQLTPMKDDVWLSLQQSDAMNGFHAVKEGDSLKLGKKQFKIIQVDFIQNSQIVPSHESKSIVFQQQMLSHYEQYGSIIDSQAGSVLSQCSAKSEVPKQCRVCLDEASSKINPLLSVCSCAGSAKFIHFECLKTWLEGKLNLRVNSPHSIEMNGKSVKCELCLTFYPSSLTFNDNTYQIYDLGDLVLGKHVTMEDEEGRIHIVNFLHLQQLIIGRGHESQVKVSEITVSRTHLAIQMVDSKLFVKDQGSKFGTLLKLQNQRCIQAGEALTLQNGRTRLTLQHEKGKHLFPLFRLCGGLCGSNQQHVDAEDQLTFAEQKA